MASEALERVGCPLDLAEDRVGVFEWLLEKYDADFFRQCERETRDRLECVSLQLYPLGLQEWFLSGDELKVEWAAAELCALLEQSALGLSETQLQENMERDMGFIFQVRDNLDAYFTKEVALFPESALKAADFNEPLDMAALSAELAGILGRLQQKIEKLESAQSLKVDLKSPQAVNLEAVFEPFAAAVKKFNAVYEREISQWKVTSVRPNAELGRVCVELRESQKALEDYLNAVSDAKRGMDTIESLSGKLPRLAVAPMFSSDSVAKIERARSALE